MQKNNHFIYLRHIKQLLAFFLLFSTISIFSQELPSFTMPSPQAYSFTKYGDVPVNEVSGKINLSIPLYNYEAGSLKLPISLSYNGSGVRVDQSTTWTGINWVLNAGGVITRIVKDLPDENEHTERIFLDETDLDAMHLVDGSQDTFYLNSYLNVPHYDTERDLFQFSFSGISGSFYLGENEAPVFTTNPHNLKIEIVGYPFNNSTLNNLNTNNAFIITDANGTKYSFGGENAYEQSQNYGMQGLQSSKRATTAYYLKKIENVFGDHIYFTYQDTGIEQLILSQSQTITRVAQFGEQYSCHPASPSCTNCCLCYDYRPDLEKSSLTDISRTFNKIYEGKYLSKISNNRSTTEILFNSSYSTGNDKIAKKILNDIEVKDNEAVIYKANLEYLYPGGIDNCDRFFLKEVTLFDQFSTSTQRPVYTMEYNQPELLPERFSFDQDHIGYFNRNGSHFNSTSLPKNGSYEFGDLDPLLANREPLFEKASKGVLTKIQYPTKGYTAFEYEASQKKQPSIQVFSLNVFNNPLIPNADLIDNTGIGNYLPPIPGEPFEESEGVFDHQEIKVKFGVIAPGEQPFNGAFPSHNYDPQNRDFIKFKVTNHTLNTEEYAFLSDDGFNRLNLCCFNNEDGSPREFSFNLIKGHHYSFNLELYSQDASLPNSPVHVSATFEYIKGYEYVNDLGVRIKRIKDYSEENKIASTKRYYYKQLKNINTFNDESSLTLPRGTYLYNSFFADACNPASGGNGSISCIWNYWRLNNLTSNSLWGVFPNSENAKNYKYVTISYGGDDFENGGVQKEFKIELDGPVEEYNTPNYPSDPLTQKNNYSVLSGKLKEEIIFSKYNDELFKTQKNSFHWSQNTKRITPNTVGGAAYDICIYRTINGYSNLLVGLYNTYSFSHNLTQKTTIDYTEPIPLDEEDDSNYNKVITTIDHEYGNLSSLPIQTTTTKSDGKQQIVKTYYPSEIINIEPSLTGDVLAASINLNTHYEHRIATPIQVETYIKEGDTPKQLISTQRNNYNTFSNGFTQMKSMQSSKNNSTLEDRIIYHKYDDQGNPVELSKADGTKVIYQWVSEHKKPLAKIENATYAEVQNATGDLRQALPNAQVTTYTYTGPLNLLSSVTDPRGDTLYYFYDAFNRLNRIKDKDGNILSKNEYNYTN